LQYDDTSASPTSSIGASHAAAAPGNAAIHIVTNVAGAVASLGSGSSPAHQCETPCTFSELDPGDYNLQVKKAGYQPVQTALQVKSGDSLDQKVQLEPLAQGL